MRALWIKVSLAIVSLFIVLGVAGVALAAFGWALPGSTLFPLQDRLEQVLIVGSSTRHADRYLVLVERRIEDLQARAGSSHEQAALEALGTSIDRAYQAIGKIPSEEVSDRFARLAALLEQADTTLSMLTELPRAQADILGFFRDQLQDLHLTISGVNLPGNLAGHQPDMTAQGGTTPDGASPVRAFFPLTGGHADLECWDCHITGEFQGVNTTCLGCHVGVTPAGHYHAACDICHTANNWQEITWNHSGEIVADCYYCHEWDAPLVHYPGQCSQCHSTTSWIEGTDYHTGPSNCWACHIEKSPIHHYMWQCSSCHTTTSWSGAEYLTNGGDGHLGIVQPGHIETRCTECHGETRCSSCHEVDRPAHHYSGQCSNCHVPDGWSGVTFLHIPTADCRSCHADTAPANHYPGQCSTCHTFDGWEGAIFNHSGFTNCISCHAANAPANHYPGQCSNCHLQTAWSDVHFNHDGLTDCISCHADTAPPDHYGGQCSLCHNPSGWANVNFNHAGLTDCISCHADNAPPDHFDGQCSSCHTPTTWGNVNFNHDGYTDCISCHAGDAPPGHYDLQCSECHTPTVWGDVNFSHDGYTDCISCHEGDRPDDHPQAQCSICHNTDSWEDAKDGVSTNESILLRDVMRGVLP